MQSPTRRGRHPQVRVLVYSSDADTRGQIRMALAAALGRRPSVDFIEAATNHAVTQRIALEDIDLAVLDAEAAPAGGLGIAKQLKDELRQCPPIAVVIARGADAWLARWSRADAVVPRPLDPTVLTKTLAPLLRSRVTAAGATRVRGGRANVRSAAR